MKKTFLLVILMIALAASFAQTPLAASVEGAICGFQRSDEQHSLHIVSDPIGAIIYKDGMNTGFITPMMFEGMTTNIAGVYHVVMSGYTFDPVNYSYDGTTDTVVNFIGTVVDPNDPPVEITEFSATITQEDFVQLTWVSQYESGMLGYRLYRSESADQAGAVVLTPCLIPATNTNTTQVYSIVDEEVEFGNTYWYWLEAVEITGVSHFYGPVSIHIGFVQITDFFAYITAQNYVQLTWTSQYESNLLGYKVYRSDDSDLSGALGISYLIQGTNTSGTCTYSFLDQELIDDGTYYYWLQVVIMYGTTFFVGPTSVNFVDNDSDCVATPFVTNLEGAYPNPFNPTTNIRYQLDGRGEVKIDIYNTRGQLVRSFSRYHDTAGSYDILWDGSDNSGRALASGVYLYKMTSGSYSCCKKLVLQK